MFNACECYATIASERKVNLPTLGFCLSRMSWSHRLYTKKEEKTWVSHVYRFGLHRFSGRNCPPLTFWVPSSFGVTHPASWENPPRLKPHPSQPTVNPNGSIGGSRRLIAHRLAVGFTFANGFLEMILETTQPKTSLKKSWAFLVAAKHTSNTIWIV